MAVNNQSQKIKSLIMKKFNENFQNFDSIRSIAEGIFDQGWRSKEDSIYEYVIGFLFGKAFKTYKSINVLCKEGYGQDAGILLRSLFEIYVSVAYISKDEPEKKAKRYYDYSYIERKHLVELFDRYELKEKGFKDAGEAIQRNREEIYRLYDEVKNNYKKEKGKTDELRWPGKSIKKMAIDCGLETNYAVVFFIFSQLVHSTSMTECLYVHANIAERRISLDAGPNEEYIEIVLPHSSTIFVRILEKFNSVFNLGKERKIEEVKNSIGIK